MTNHELSEFLQNVEATVNDAIDKLIVRRQQEADKAFSRYVIKKLEVVIGAIHKVQDKLPVEFKL